MGIVLKNILAVLPEGEKDVVKETDIYIEGSRIAAIGQKPEGFIEEKVIDGKVTMENRKVLTLDEELVYQKINEIIVRMELDKKEY